MFEIELIAVGRCKVNKTIKDPNVFGITEAELRALKELDQCVMSLDYFIEEESPGNYGAYVGIGRRVGTIKIREIN